MNHMFDEIIKSRVLESSYPLSPMRRENQKRQVDTICYH